MADVLLIQPPIIFKKGILKNDILPNCPHLGLLYLAAGIKNAGLSVDILDVIDVSCQIDDILKHIRKNNVKIVGITAMTMNIRGALEIAKSIKNNLQNSCYVCLGGPHLSADHSFIERYPYFNFGVRGEADITFPKIVTDILLKGIEYNGLIEAEPPLNLDELPTPTRETVDYSFYIQKRGLWANHLMATRGCPFSCIFCSIPAMLRKFRRRNPKLVVSEIRELIRLNKLSHFIFSDDIFTLDREYVLNLCNELMNLDKKITWEVQTRPSLVDDKLLKIMNRARCKKILFGVESGSERIRNEVINKNITNKQIKEATKLCWKNNIEPDWYLMLGFPTETKKELYETINFPVKTKPGPNIIGVHITMPLPGSKIFNSMIENKEINENIIDDFVIGKLGDGYKDVWPYYVPKGLSLEDLKKARKLTYSRFYLRISYVIKRLLRDFFSFIKIKQDVIQAVSLFLYGRAADDK